MLLITALLFSYCTENKNSTYKSIGGSEIVETNFNVDSINLNIDNNSSKYFLKIIDSKLYFVDRLFGLIKSFDLEGNLIDISLGKKKYPQIGELYSISYNKGYFYITDNMFLYKFDNSFNLVKNGSIIFKPNILSLDPDNPNPEQIMFYQLNYNAMNTFESMGNNLILPVEMELPNLNPFNINTYYKKAYNFALMDLNNFKVFKLFNNWSLPYAQNKNYPFLTRNSCVIDNNKLYINHEADTNIYVMDENLTPLYKFGIKPKKINRNYTSTEKLSDAFDPNLSPNFRNLFGYFKQIIVEDQIVLRTFNVGLTELKSKNNFGIQIYKNHKLINEILLPEEMEILGYIKSVVYLYKTEIETGKNLKIYKLKLDI